MAGLSQSQSSSFDIHKGDENLLGIWSYGNIYKATCDYLPCVKYSTPILFQTKNPQSLYQEVASLQDLRHPNIVLHLGCYQDPETKLPVLFTELMDESLTSFLNRSHSLLPYHTQLDLSHEVALALAYLHAKKLIHRNLSGSSVMLVNNRAKVTDFAVSKLEEVSKSSRQRFPLTKEEFYLPPEALKKAPIFSIKMDSFSFSVLLVQIITRQYPNPSDDLEVVEYPQTPLGIVYKPVMEIDRRKGHISLIGEHSLKLTITKCLAFKAEDRPCAGELCQKISKLKEQDEYRSSRRSKNVDASKLPDNRDYTAQPVQHEINLTWLPAEQTNYTKCAISVVKGDTIYFTDYSEYTYAYHCQERNWSKICLQGRSEYAITVIEGKLTAIGGKIGCFIKKSLISLIDVNGAQKWVKYYPQMTCPRNFATATVYKETLVIVGGSSNTPTEILDITQNQKKWVKVKGLTYCGYRTSLTIVDDTLYLTGQTDSCNTQVKTITSCSIKDLLAYQDQKLTWKNHTEPPFFASGYVAINGKLLAFGGQAGNDQYLCSKKTSDEVYEYDPESDSWQSIDHMPNARSHACITVLPNNKLLVVGGYILSETLEPKPTAIIDTATLIY